LEQTITWPASQKIAKGILFEPDGKVGIPFSLHLKEKVVDFFRVVNIILSLGKLLT